ncbi:uncharacterized protein EV420DRAFT_1314236 [Desarmillaria tabescens]|uniref:Integrase core domain-containing protein n=1 Tax=Armillaria tabescens TaxID=1929756 RepID=A0AA39JM50_ARMTA|nr:uncharacterized protein EV420DRAFT_1314236 [Desarmillaria tabescens]KAK0445297.1 hypothetical protein EV420DRAFT_1314236 [Desarmillaria tabescens]
MASHGLNRDPVHHFLTESYSICTEALFIINSLPNVELAAVERAVHQLYAVRTVFLSLDDPHLQSEDINTSDSLETFRKIFTYLEEQNLLDMENSVHRICLFLVFHPRIQASLNRTRDAWNHHQLRTEHYKTPIAIYELSREKAIRRGYWTGDPGDHADQVRGDPHYGVDGDIENDYPYAPPEAVQEQDPADTEVNHDEDIDMARKLMGDFDFERDDLNWGIEVYCEVVSILTAILASANDCSDHSGSE